MSEELSQVQPMSYQQAIEASLSGDLPVQTTDPVIQETSTEPIVDETPTEVVAEEPLVTSEVEVSEQVEETPQPDTPAFDPIAWLKENGLEVDSIDTLKSKLNTPAPEPLYKEPEFANEESKRLYESFLAGDKKAIKAHLDKVELVESIATKTPEEIVKIGWKDEYGLTDKEADKRFAKLYSIADEELMDDEDKAIEQKLLAKQIATEANKYKDYFQKYNTEISLPSIAQSAPQDVAPVESEEAKKAAAYAFELVKNLPTDFSKVEYEFNDEKGFKLKGQVKIPEKEINNIKTQFAGHEDKYLAARWFNQDGSAKEDLIAADIWYLQNRDKVINAGISDAVHKTRIELMKENRNRQVTGNVVQGDFSPSREQAEVAAFTDWIMAAPQKKG